MKINKAVITAAGPEQRALPLQTLIDRDGQKKSVLEIIVEETFRAGVEDICVVVCPGDEKAYTNVAGAHAERLSFIQQKEHKGYGHAVFCAREFVGKDPFLHLVGDHLYVSRDDRGCARQLVEAAQREGCAMSAVQATRENLLPYFGVIGGARLKGREDMYRVETVIEKPTPTRAEQGLIVSGLRAGHYLCFFGMHVLTIAVMEELAREVEADKGEVTLSCALSKLAKMEQYLALEVRGLRYDVGHRYGLFIAQMALALSGEDRDEVLSKMLELMALRELGGLGR